jgi:hypothetical protein
MPYAHWQQMQDGAAPTGRFHYWKSVNFNTLGDDALDLLAGAAATLPTAFTDIHVQHLGGAVARVAPGETAFAHRNSTFFVNLIGASGHADGFEPVRTWVRGLHDRMLPMSAGSTMTNFSDHDDRDPRRLFGDLAQRLGALRRRYDPAGILGGER